MLFPLHSHATLQPARDPARIVQCPAALQGVPATVDLSYGSFKVSFAIDPIPWANAFHGVLYAMCDEDAEDCRVLVDACACKRLAVPVHQGPRTHLHEPGHAADWGWQLEGQGGPRGGTSTHSDVAEGEDGLEEGRIDSLAVSCGYGCGLLRTTAMVTWTAVTMTTTL